MLCFCPELDVFGSAGLEIVQHLIVFVQNLMVLDPLADQLDVFGPAGLEIVQNLDVFGNTFLQHEVLGKRLSKI